MKRGRKEKKLPVRLKSWHVQGMQGKGQPYRKKPRFWKRLVRRCEKQLMVEAEKRRTAEAIGLVHQLTRAGWLA